MSAIASFHAARAFGEETVRSSMTLASSTFFSTLPMVLGLEPESENDRSRTTSSREHVVAPLVVGFGEAPGDSLFEGGLEGGDLVGEHHVVPA